MLHVGKVFFCFAVEPWIDFNVGLDIQEFVLYSDH